MANFSPWAAGQAGACAQLGNIYGRMVFKEHLAAAFYGFKFPFVAARFYGLGKNFEYEGWMEGMLIYRPQPVSYKGGRLKYFLVDSHLSN